MGGQRDQSVPTVCAENVQCLKYKYNIEIAKASNLESVPVSVSSRKLQSSSNNVIEINSPRGIVCQ